MPMRTRENWDKSMGRSCEEYIQINDECNDSGIMHSAS